MTAGQFRRVRARLDAACSRLMTNKNREYGQRGDFLDNFNVAAKVLKVPPQIVAGIYLYKHVKSLYHYLGGGRQSSGESVFSRIQDARNYLDFLYAILKENQRPASKRRKDG